MLGAGPENGLSVAEVVAEMQSLCELTMGNAAACFSLELGFSTLGKRGTMMLCAALHEHGLKVRSLQLQSCQLGDGGAGQLARAPSLPPAYLHLLVYTADVP